MSTINEEFRKCIESPYYFYKNYWKVFDKDGNEIKPKVEWTEEEFNTFFKRITQTKTKMNNPQLITVLEPKSTYQVPTFKVITGGMADGEPATIRFCKGNKEDESVPRQEGFFTETLIAVAKKYLEENNVGDLASREGSMAITKLDEALMWIEKRAKDRAARGVQGTYQK